MVWALHADGDHALLGALNDFLTSALNNGFVDQIEERYLDAARHINFLDLAAFRKRVFDTLPRYRHSFVEAAAKTDQDWRLIAALSYQESMWDPMAVSPTGVRGIMQLTKDTAALLKVDRDDVLQSIDGGAKYLRQLRDRLPTFIGERIVPGWPSRPITSVRVISTTRSRSPRLLGKIRVVGSTLRKYCRNSKIQHSLRQQNLGPPVAMKRCR